MFRRFLRVAGALVGLSAVVVACGPTVHHDGGAKTRTPIALPAYAAPREAGLNYGLGRPASTTEIRLASISIAPNGQGLPTGHGNVFEGRRIYEEQCAACHGANGEGSHSYPPLVGGQGTLTGRHPLKTIGSYWPYATTVFDYIRRAMPYAAPGSLSPDQTYAVTAYLLACNKIIDERTALNQNNLAKVKMPNQNGFVGDTRPDIMTR